MNLFDCSPAHAGDLIFWSAIILVLYLILAITRFIPAARAGLTKRAKYAWGGLTTIFIFCGITGYGSTIVSGWYAAEAYALKVWFMKLGAGSCALFWYLTQGYVLEMGTAKEAMDALEYEDDHPLERIAKARNILGSSDE